MCMHGMWNIILAVLNFVYLSPHYCHTSWPSLVSRLMCSKKASHRSFHSIYHLLQSILDLDFSHSYYTSTKFTLATVHDTTSPNGPFLSGHSQLKPPSLMWPNICAAVLISPSCQRLLLKCGHNVLAERVGLLEGGGHCIYLAF